LRIDARNNVFDSNAVLILQLPAPGIFQPNVDQQLLPRCMAWSESKNHYGGNLLMLAGQGESVWAVKSLKEWQSYWGLKDAGSLQGKVLYQGGDVRTRKSAEPDTLALADFRLHADSPGKGTGEGGRDLGADVTLVGPGPAYERWKKTPEYQQWLKDTGENVPPPASVAAAVRRPLSPASAAAIARSKQQLAEQAQFGWRGYVVVGRFRLANASLADFQDKVASQLEILADGQMVGIVADPAKPIVFRASGYETAQLVVQDVVKDFDPATQEPIDIGEVALQKLPAAAVPSISGQVTWELPELRSPTTVLVLFTPDPLNTPGNFLLGQTGRHSIVVGPDGKFDVPAMSPGKFDLKISAPGFALCRRLLVQLARGERKEMGQLLLERARVAKITWVHAQQPPFDTSHPVSGELKADVEWRAKSNASYPHDLLCWQFGKQIHLNSGFITSYVALGPGELKDFANFDIEKAFKDRIGNQTALEPGHVYLIRAAFTPYILLRVESVD
jgi:hypothetical protein